MRLPLATKVSIGVFGLAGLACLNFVGGGCVLAFAFGGFAQLGYVEADHHFQGTHGRYTEVSAETFWACLWYWRITLAALAHFIVLSAAARVWSRRVLRT